MSNGHPIRLRRSERLPVEVTIRAKHAASKRIFQAELSEFSANGCRINTSEPIATDDHLLIKLPELEGWPGRVVWSSCEAIGLEFLQPLHPAVVEHYARKFPPAESKN